MSADEPLLCDAIVAMVHKRACTVLYEGAYWRCKVADGAFRDVDNAMVVGDHVRFLPDDKGGGVVYRTNERTTRLVRMREGRQRRAGAGREHVLAANIDRAVIVAATTRPTFRMKLIDRYLVMCQYGGIAPVICINKCDLDTPPDLGAYDLLDVPVVHTSAQTGEGIDELRALLVGRFSVFCGHSGVGKSSLTNRLLGREAMEIQEVREHDGRGRHTTTVSTLFPIEGGGYIVDTPGIRSWGLWEVDAETLKDYFPEFGDRSDSCHFRDCKHTVEPYCAVREAVDSGELPRQRYLSYLRMLADE
ncbi:MAG: ribosome small subunit-dependent GTPase A [Myxococcales bacterium]|nr:ribosome small subunit-dependent GTPase A [Myxococcales bacterium]